MRFFPQHIRSQINNSLLRRTQQLSLAAGHFNTGRLAGPEMSGDVTTERTKLSHNNTAFYLSLRPHGRQQQKKRVHFLDVDTFMRYAAFLVVAGGGPSGHNRCRHL